jgi:hypothetical protein
MTVNTDLDSRGTAKHGRASGAPGFPQAVRMRIACKRQEFGTRPAGARQKPAPPYCVYWMDTSKD